MMLGSRWVNGNGARVSQDKSRKKREVGRNKKLIKALVHAVDLNLR